MDSINEWQGLKFWIGFLLGRHLVFPESRLFMAESAINETNPRKYVIMGGDKTAWTPIRLSIDPAAVRIIAPGSFRDHDEAPFSSPGIPCPVPWFTGSGDLRQEPDCHGYAVKHGKCTDIRASPSPVFHHDTMVR